MYEWQKAEEQNKEHGEIEANGKSNPPVVDPVAEEGAAIIVEA